jgi:hypothetical protein
MIKKILDEIEANKIKIDVKNTPKEKRLKDKFNELVELFNYYNTSKKVPVNQLCKEFKIR